MTRRESPMNGNLHAAAEALASVVVNGRIMSWPQRLHVAATLADAGLLGGAS